MTLVGKLINKNKMIGRSMREIHEHFVFDISSFQYLLIDTYIKDYSL